jgi:hypothetical protein
MSRKAVDMTGMRFGRLLCIAPLGSTKTGMVWECLCDCGKITQVVRGNLLSNNVRSCGCLWAESRKANGEKIVHGHAKIQSSTYTSWEAMRQRCNNPHNDYYHRYGGRGIKICERWNEFSNFLEDMGERPPGKTLDRKDNNKNYCKENCKWSTPKEQANNK